jgi:PAS domain-containing protein
MTEPTGTQILPVFDWLDPRAHPLGDTWLLTIFTILLSIGLPRVVGGLRIDLAACALGLLTLAMIHVGFAVVAARLAGRPQLRTRLLTALHLLGVVTVAFIWLRAGGLQNPALLGVFVLPVIGAVFISRWQSYATAALSVLTVVVLASGQVPAATQGHWYVPGLRAAAEWLSAVARQTDEAGRPFAAFYAPAGYYAVVLQVFAVVVFGCAVAAEYLRTVYDRLNAHVAMARSETLRSRGLWSALVEELPLPAALVDADTHEILCASAAAIDAWAVRDGAIAGRGFFEVVKFSYPEAIEALINGRDGVEPLSVVHTSGQLRATEVRVRHIAQDGRRLALVTVSDTTEAFCMGAALDAAEHAALVVDATGRMLALNKPARAVFPEATAGGEVSKLVPEAGDGVAWWDPGISRCKKMHLTVTRRVYQVTATAVALPGEEERLYVIAFVPTSAFAGRDRGATTVRAAALVASSDLDATTVTSVRRMPR